MMKRFSGVLLFIVLFRFLSQGLGELAELDDDNFEHETQASTGMTTGSWFVLFKAERCGFCRQVLPEFERLANDEELRENGIVLATLDVPSNRKTAVRFNIRGFPVFLYLHRGKVYEFRGQRVYDVFKKFLLEGVPKFGEDGDRGYPIPPPLSSFQEVMYTLKAAYNEIYDLAVGKNGNAGRGIVLLLATSLGLMLGLISMLFLPFINHSIEKEKQKKEKRQ